MDLFSVYRFCPVMLQNILCSIHGYRLEKQRYNKEYFKILETLLDSENWTAEQIFNYKEENTYKIIEYAYRHCAFYRNLYASKGLTPGDFKGMDSLQKFPIVSKEDIRNNWRGMLSDEYQKKELIPYHTSGSTGKALDFYWTRYNLQYYWAIVWRGRKRFGIEKGDMHLNFTGKIVVPVEQSKPPYWRYNRAINQYMLNMQHITKNKIIDIVNFINSKDFLFFVGYPSIINSLAVLVDEMDLKIRKSPQFIFSSAEKMYSDQKSIIESVFNGAKVIEHYGFSENAAAASKCKKNVYHEDFELGHLELKDPVIHQGDMKGELLATGFQNLAMPFIRYSIGDTAIFSKERCECGLKSQVIKDIEGRNEDYIITPEGAHVMRLDYIFKGTSSIRECQIIQKKLGEIIIRIVRRDNYSILVEKNILENIKTFISPTLCVRFEYVNEIERTKSGKFKAVVSELKK